MFPHVVLDDGVLARGPVLVLEPFEDALGGVALLPGKPKIIFQYPVNDARKWLQLGRPGRALPPLPRRRRICHHLAHRVPVQTECPRRFPDAPAFDHHRPADTKIHFHSYVRCTTRRLYFEPMDDGGRSSLQLPYVSD